MLSILAIIELNRSLDDLAGVAAGVALMTRGDGVCCFGGGGGGGCCGLWFVGAEMGVFLGVIFGA